MGFHSLRYISILLASIVFAFAATAYAGPKAKSKRDLNRIYKFERRLARRILSGKISPIELSNLAAASKLTDSDGDGIPDIIESAKGTLDACDTDTDGDGKDDGEDDDNGASSSSSSSGGSSSSSSDDNSSSSSSSSSGGSSSSSTSDDD
ncbi:MAG: hypothetical protein KDD64_05560 [Bdellovibrionales bacterium]|nr:hypothetical protein [Bdellovibrionales bacterium]